MDTPEHRPAAGAEARAGRPRIMSPALVLVFIAGFAALTSFYLLLSVVPLYATSVGAGGLGAGAATGTLMLATVAAELATPRLVARFGYRPVLAAALLLLGAPALALPAARSLPAILAICAVRGLGFAVVVVVGGALVASLVPHERRGEGLGLYGVVVGVPGVVGLPLGVWLAATPATGRCSSPLPPPRWPPWRSCRACRARHPPGTGGPGCSPAWPRPPCCGRRWCS